jgi:hypothetical protein
LFRPGTAIQRRISRHCSILFLLETAAALPHVHRLSLARSTTAAPPHPARSAVDVPIPPRLAGCRTRAGTATRWFPCSLWFAQWSRSPTVSQRPRHQYAADLPGDLPRAG